MKTCPECKGRKKFKIPSGDPLHVYAINGPVVYETYVCENCSGTGKVSNLSFAIYKARGGGSAPPQMRGFA